MYTSARAKKEFEKHILRHMLPTFILWLISKEPVHGYELIKKIKGDKGVRVANASQIYPILKELTQKGMITQKRALQGRRVRKIYHVTGKGREMFREASRCLRESPLKREFMRELAA